MPDTTGHVDPGSWCGDQPATKKDPCSAPSFGKSFGVLDSRFPANSAAELQNEPAAPLASEKVSNVVAEDCRGTATTMTVPVSSRLVQRMNLKPPIAG